MSSESTGGPSASRRKGPQTQFVQVPFWIAFHDDLTDGQVRTWMTLCRVMDYKTRVVTISQSRLGELRGITRGTAHRHCLALAAAGAIRVEGRHRANGDTDINRYVVAFDHPINVDPETVTAGAIDRASARALDRADPCASDRAAISTSHLDTPNPNVPSGDQPILEPDPVQGATAPRTPRVSASRGGSRASGTNPRALQARQLQQVAERESADRLERGVKNRVVQFGGVLELDEFLELVVGEIDRGNEPAGYWDLWRRHAASFYEQPWLATLGLDEARQRLGPVAAPPKDVAAR